MRISDWSSDVCSSDLGGAVTGQADEGGLLVERTPDGLADPDRGVRGELEALAPVALVDRVLEAEVALLHEVEELHARGKGVARSEARRVGRACVSTCRSRWSR